MMNPYRISCCGDIHFVVNHIHVHLAFQDDVLRDLSDPDVGSRQNRVDPAFHFLGVDAYPDDDRVDLRPFTFLALVNDPDRGVAIGKSEDFQVSDFFELDQGLTVGAGRIDGRTDRPDLDNSRIVDGDDRPVGQRAASIGRAWTD